MAFFLNMRKIVKQRRVGSPRLATVPPASRACAATSPRVLLSLPWYAPEIHRGIARYAEQAGWNLDLSWVHDSLLPAKWDGDGILCVAGVNVSIDRRILHYHKPTVNIGNTDQFPAPRVAADMEKVVQLTIEHFTQRGFRHLAYYVRLGTRPELVKCRVFEFGAAAAGVTFHVINCSASPDRERLRQLGRQLARLPKPLAATAQMDEFAVELIQAGCTAGLRIPEDVAVLGCNDDRLICPFALVPLSSIDNNLEGIGYRAGELLDGLMRGEAPPDGPILIPPRGITVRPSTDILAIADEDVLAALEIIKARYHDPLSAKRVAAEVHVSERKLFDSFKRHLGHSVKHEIMRRRLERAAELLTQTDTKIQNIAWQAGFATLSQMTKVFRRVRATTPGAFRRAMRRRVF